MVQLIVSTPEFTVRKLFRVNAPHNTTTLREEALNKVLPARNAGDESAIDAWLVIYDRAINVPLPPNEKPVVDVYTAFHKPC
jgi:hypothetical protein